MHERFINELFILHDFHITYNKSWCNNLYSIEETSELTEVMASSGTETSVVKKVMGVVISNIGKKMKNAEKVKEHLASKASVEEKILQ